MDVSKFIVTDLRQTLPIAPQSSSFLTMLSLPHSQSPFHTSPCCSHLTFFLPTHYPLILSDLLRTSLSRLKNPCFKAGFFNSTVYAATASVVSDSVRPHRWQPTRFPRPWDSPGKNPGVGCHFLLQCTTEKSESEVAQSCPTLSDPMDCIPPGSSIHGIFQARVLEWGAIAFSRGSP